MASLSVDEKDWLQEQFRIACESLTNATMEKTWDHLRNAPKQCDLAKLESEGYNDEISCGRKLKGCRTKSYSRYRILIIMIKRSKLACYLLL